MTTDYLLTYPEQITIRNAELWVRLCRAVWIRQVELVHCFEWGTFAPDEEVYPGGWDEIASVIQYLQDAGIGVGANVYSVAIPPEDITEISTYYGPAALIPETPAVVPTTIEGLRQIVNNLVAMTERLNLNRIHLDAIAWGRRVTIDGETLPTSFTREVYERLDGKVGLTSAMPGFDTHQYMCLHPVLDNKTDPCSAKSVADQIALFLPEIRPSLGWRHFDLITDTEELGYLLDKAVEHGAAIGWQGLFPGVSLDDRRVQMIAMSNLRKLLGGV